MTKVELSDDLKHAKAFISVLPEEQAKLTMHGLTSATGRLRRDVMERIHIKEMPTLKLVYDEGHKAEMEVFALLERDRQEKEALEQGSSSFSGESDSGSADSDPADISAEDTDNQPTDGPTDGQADKLASGEETK